MVTASPKTLAEAAEHLRANDPILKPVIERSGPCTIEPHQDYYRELVESIVGQQLSVKAAAAIRRKFLDLFGGTFPEPTAILAKTPEELRTAGLSFAKARYIQDLAQHVIDGKVKFDHLDALSNEDIIKELIDIKGVGEWTAHMSVEVGYSGLHRSLDRAVMFDIGDVAQFQYTDEIALGAFIDRKQGVAGLM